MKKDLKKIVMIGPVYPYKGGIAHYTGLMCKALRKKIRCDHGVLPDAVSEVFIQKRTEGL
ncbi:MAG: hypothetical protein ACLTBD_05760 [Clostridia bacterium]